MPSEEIVRKIKKEIRSKADYVFFFDSLKSASWVTPLAKEKFFKSPPRGERSDAGTHFPSWPESQFLVRIVSQAPDLVVKIALKIPDTENPQVHQDILAIALQVPPATAKMLSFKIEKIIESPFNRRNYPALGQYVSHLAKGGEIKPALRIARKLLAFRPDPEEKEKIIRSKKSNDESLFVRLEPQPKSDPYAYQEILKTNVPDLAKVAPVESVRLMSFVLDEAIRMSTIDPKNAGNQDWSFIWYPSFDSVPHGIHHGLKPLIAASLATVLDSALSQNKKLYFQIEKILSSFKWRVFDRMLMRASCVSAKQAKFRLRKYILNLGKFDGFDFSHEYLILVRDHFGLLSKNEQRKIIRYILRGPDLTKYKRDLKAWKGDTKKAEVAHFARRWKVLRLFPIKAYLNSKETGDYKELIKNATEPTEADYVHSHGSFTSAWGPHSPKTQEELSEEDPRSVADYLRTCQFVKGFNQPSPEGLARALQAAVKNQAKKYSKVADVFEGLEPHYVRGLISGLQAAVKEGQPIDWSSALKLCLWVVRQSVTIPGKKEQGWDWNLGDPSWKAARKEVAGLIGHGSWAGAAEIPFALRGKVFEILSVLTDDKDPTATFEQRSTWADEPATLSINTVRGEAMHSLIAHAIWVHRHLSLKEPKTVNISQMSEVKNILEQKLDIKVEATYAIRSVYGQFFRHLCHIDVDWVNQNLKLIFPTSNEKEKYRTVAWNTYVTFNPATPFSFRILSGEYKNAVANLKHRSNKNNSLGDPDKYLAEHLITLYWSGVIGFDGADSLMSQFYKKADPSLRIHIVDFVGRALKNEKRALPSEVKDRLISFWGIRLREARQNFSNDIGKEIQCFAWWLESEKFNLTWSLAQTENILRLCDKIEHEYVFLEALSKFSDILPLESVQCLLIIITKLGVDQLFMLDHDKIVAILKAAFASRNERAVQIAKDVQNLLVARGHFRFRMIS